MNLKRKTLILIMATIAILAGQQTKADFVFGEPEILGPRINSPDKGELLNCISSDGLEMYLQYGSPELGHWDIAVSKRATADSDWGPVEDLGSAVNTTSHEEHASLSADGLTLYFDSDRQDGYGSSDIWVTTRLTRDAPWTMAVNMGPKVNSSRTDGQPWISIDDLELYFISSRSGGYGDTDIWVVRRETKNAPWEEPVNLGLPINSQYRENTPRLSPDGLILFFGEHESGPFRPDGFGSSDLWMSTRPRRTDPWGSPVNLGPSINGPYTDDTPALSHDGKTLYFSSKNRPENYSSFRDIWQAPIIPIVDLNADGIVDAADMCIIVDNWGTDEPLCDIGPMPWGDGLVDVQDLIVLSEHLFEEFPPAE